MKTLKLIVVLLVVTVAFSTCNTKPRYVDITGKVIDMETGAPVEGVKVIADSFYSSEDNGKSSSAFSDANGSFEFPHFRMSYPGVSLKNQKTSYLSLYTSSSDYIQENIDAYKLEKHATKFFENIYVTCIAKGFFSISVNSSYVYDYGTVTGKRCKIDGSNCEGIAGGSGTTSGIYSFTPSSLGTFQVYTTAGNMYNNIIITQLYNSGVLVKTQIDTLTGLNCKSSYNYTITIN